MEGPRTINHNFSASFCEVKLKITLYNSSDSSASIFIHSLDSNPSTGQLSDVMAGSSGNQAGWYDASLVNDIKVTTDVLGMKPGKPPSMDSVSQFIWSGSSSIKVEVKPMSTAEVPLQVCVFSPGTYDLSNYALHWNLLSSKHEGSHGKCLGSPFYLTVLESA